MAEAQAPTFTLRRAIAAGGIMAMSNFMVVLDTSIANVSVPHISGSLAVAPDQGTWVITSYSVAEAICVPLTGWLVQRFGAVRTYIACMIGFALFSMLCGVSVSLGMLVAARVGQGLCGGPIMPITQTLLLRVFPPKQRGTAMGLWAMTTVVAPVAGPLLGGTISDNWSWHWIFFINIPIAVACVTGAILMLRQVETPTNKVKIDFVGLVLLVVWVGALQIMLDIGRDNDWFSSAKIQALGIVALVGFAFFIIWEITADQPVVNLRVFRHRGFTFAVIALALIYGTLFSSVVVTPQWLQGAMGYTAADAGYVLAWQGVFAVVMAPLVGRLSGSGKVDPRMLVTAGTLWLAMSVALRTHWSTDVGYWTLAIPHILNGFGMPLFFVPITFICLSSVDPAETASAAGLSNFVRTLSGAVGTSFATTLFANRAVIDRADLVNIVQPPAAFADGLAQRGIGAEQARGLLSTLIDQQATVIAITQLFQIAAVAFVIAAVAIWFVPRPKRAASMEGAH
ncbi:DHA2 family efflux MFS transporter permease subunit [Sphingomonas sp. MMS24-J13]|uniref:DHA2 family efflux MFS transporter permease subunit n=1 Tax=Sphingomonas sp. MMS24-J13 TaxID=3238686 RepID=UPI00384C51A1